MSVHSNRSSVSRRPVGGQMPATSGQPSSPVPSHLSRSTSVSSEPILYDTSAGLDIPFRPANPATSSTAAPSTSFGVEQQHFTMETNVSAPQPTESDPAGVPQSYPAPEMSASFSPGPSSEPTLGHSTLEVVPEAYFNNFWSPEPISSAGMAGNNQIQPQANVPSAGWATASPQPSHGQPSSESPMNLQLRPQSTVSSTVSSTGWATSTQEPVQQVALSFQYPPSEDLSPHSMPGMAPTYAPMPQPLFSGPATPASSPSPMAMSSPSISMAPSPMTTVTSPMTAPSSSGMQPGRPPPTAAKQSSRIPSNARPPVLNYNPQRSTESASFASACCQCFNAITYNTYYYNCTYCKLDICGTCFQAGQHPWTHLPSMVRLHAKETKAGDSREDKQCDNCKAMKHRRMDCDECPYSVCLACYGNTATPVHKHKSYQLKATPGLTMSVRRGDGSPCCTQPSFGHCGRCEIAWKAEEWMVQCKTCLFEFEEVVALCLQCDSEILSACRQSQHQLVSMKCRQRSRSEQGVQPSQGSIECTECAIQFQSLTDISFHRHPHTNYEFLFFTEDREHLFAAVYRSCKKKTPRTDTPHAPISSTVKCSHCHHNFPTNTVQTCIPCKTVKYCSHCYSIAASTHQHGSTSFVSQTDLVQTQLGGGWTQRKNSAGRNWFHHTRTNTRSFEFPKSANGQAPQPSAAVPMQVANGRRATTGGIPSGQPGPLPPGWEARKTADGRRYYANHSTKQTSWQRPTSIPRQRPAGQVRHGSVPLQGHTGGVQWESQAVAPATHMTAEQKALAKQQAERKQMMTKIGTSVLRGVVSGVVKAERRGSPN